MIAPPLAEHRAMPDERGNEGLGDQNSDSWNRIAGWLRHIDQLRLGA